jgi:HAAS domain-containing protein
VSGDRYVHAVEMQLLGLPWRVRKNLVADLRVHLSEIPAVEDLVARLGSPQSYAGELRSAAGLAPRRGLRAFVRARRPRNVVVAVALVGVAAAVAAAVTWARSYQPVGAGSTGMSPVVSSEGALGETVAPFLNGKPFEMGLFVRNSGRFAVRILDVPLAGIHPFVARKFTARSDERGTGPPVRFQPFTLEPGRERLIVLRGRYANCHDWAAGTSVGYEAMPVRMRFLRWTHTIFVKLFTPLVIRMPAHRSPCATG